MINVPFNGYKILLVDDEVTTVFGYKSEMEMLDIKVDGANTLHEAEEFLTSGTYQAVVTDLNLSGKMDLDGLLVIRTTLKYQPQAVIIVITGIGDDAIKKIVFDAGAHYYLEKPVEAQSIIALFK
ncbi:MAG: response regulator [Fibrobacteria bacterium]|nr:response regulator [Fibrobacteria bacterium]